MRIRFVSCSTEVGLGRKDWGDEGCKLQTLLAAAAVLDEHNHLDSRNSKG
jgi:hypothetical protein